MSIRAAVLAAVAVAAPAFAGVAPFQIFENQGGVNTAGLDLAAILSDGGSHADFTITNNAYDGVVTRIVIENTAATAQLGAFSFAAGGLGDNWSSSPSGGVPGSISNHSGAWAGTLLNLTANPSPTRNGIDLGESLTFRFALGGTSFQAINSAFVSGEFRLVAHIQSIGEQSVWGTTTVVPTPATLALTGLAGLTAARRRRTN